MADIYRRTDAPARRTISKPRQRLRTWAQDMEDNVQPNVVSEISTDRGDAVRVANSSGAGEAAASSAFESAVSAAADDCLLLQVRFYPDTRVWEIAERPEHLDKEEWFKLLCARAGANFQARAGGRGFFRLTRPQLEALKIRNPN